MYNKIKITKKHLLKYYHPTSLYAVLNMRTVQCQDAEKVFKRSTMKEDETIFLIYSMSLFVYDKGSQQYCKFEAVIPCYGKLFASVIAIPMPCTGER